MLPELRTRHVPSLFEDFDTMFDRMWSRWPAITHQTTTSRFASYEDDKGYTLQVTLPEGCTADKIKAEVKDGTLHLFIEKPELPSDVVDIIDASTGTTEK